MPGTAVEASSASQIGPSRSGAEVPSVRSTAMQTRGTTVSSKLRSAVVSRKIWVIRSSPVLCPDSERLKTSATVSGVNAPRRVRSISAASIPSAT